MNDMQKAKTLVAKANSDIEVAPEEEEEEEEKKTEIVQEPSIQRAQTIHTNDRYLDDYKVPDDMNSG